MNLTKKKYLVVLAGSPRGGERAWESLYKYVIDHLDADLAICIGDKFYKKNSLVTKSTYKWIFKEPDNWSKYFSERFSNTWKEYLLLGQEFGMAGGLDNFSGSGAIVSGLKNIIHENYLSVLKNYEYIIYSRFDQMYTDYHPKLTGKNIWIPEGEDYFGICDRHSIFSSEYADKFFQICEYFDSDDGFNNAPEHVTPESVFLNHLQSINLGDKIIRIKRFQFTVSEENDATRWRVAKYKIHLYSGLKMKYPDEFIASISNFLKEYGVLKSIFLQPRMLINFMYLKLRRVLGQIIPNKMKKHLSKNKI